MGDEMATTELAELEEAIRELDGVLGCVILTDEAGTVSQIEAFASSGADHAAIQQQIHVEAARRGLDAAVKRVIVMELETESLFPGHDSLEKLAEEADEQLRSRHAEAAAEALSELAIEELQALTEQDADNPLVDRVGRLLAPRAPVRQVALSTTSTTYEAEVTLGGQAFPEVLGIASGEKAAQGLAVLAEATLKAAERLVGGHDITLLGAVMNEVAGRTCVAVLVQMPDGLELVGTALVRDRPVSEAAVRATLDAVNRRLLMA